jgi:hypothetical protein
MRNNFHRERLRDRKVPVPEGDGGQELVRLVLLLLLLLPLPLSPLLPLYFCLSLLPPPASSTSKKNKVSILSAVQSKKHSTLKHSVKIKGVLWSTY